MTAPTTTVPAVKTYLVGLLASTLGAAVLVVNGDPVDPPPTNDVASVGAVERTVEPLAMVGSGGANWLQEHYTVTVSFSAYAGGDDSAALDAHVWGLHDAFEPALRADPTFGGLVARAAPVTSFQPPVGWAVDENEQPIGRLTTVEMTIEVLAAL